MKRDGVELIWRDKYDDKHERRAISSKSAELDRHEIIPGDKRAANRLIHGDNLEVMNTLLQNGTSLDLIYIDPPFATGSDFTYNPASGTNIKVKARAYKDRWRDGFPEFLNMLAPRLQRAYDLLSEQGSLYLHLDYRTAPAMRFVLDEIFGHKNFVNEIVWFYKTGGLPDKLGFGRKHDTILFYVKDRKQALWNPQKEKSYLAHRYGFSNIKIHEDKQGRYTMVNCRDVLDVPALRGNQPERVNYPTQKPIRLLERILAASSNEDSLIADFFCGSGTTAMAAESLGRQWIACDTGAWAIQSTRKRVFARTERRPTELLVSGENHSFPGAAHISAKSQDLQTILTLEYIDWPKPLPDDAKNLLDLCDEWAIDWTSSHDSPFQAQWRSHRSRRQKELTLESPPLPFELAHLDKVRIRAVDVYGRVIVTGATLIAST